MEVTRSYRFPGFDDIDANGFSRGQRDLSTEEFVGAITGRPSPADTAAFVAAITDRPNPDQTAMKALVKLLTQDQTPASRAALGAIAFREQYNPNEPRDWRGRWTTGGAGGGPATGGAATLGPRAGHRLVGMGAAPSALCLISLPQAILRLNGMGQLHSHPALLPFPRRWAARVLEPSL